MNEKAKTLLAKVRFFEAVARDADLGKLEWRVCVMLVSLWSPRRGYAYPTLRQISDNLGVEKRNVERAISGLERKGVIRVERPQRQGRGRANRYLPAFDTVPEGNVFDLEKASPATTFSQSSDTEKGVNSDDFSPADCDDGKGVIFPEKASSVAQKGVTGDALSEGLSEEDSIRSFSKARMRTCAPSPGSIFDMADHEILGAMKNYERALRTGIEVDGTAWQAFLEEVVESFEPHKGSGIGGMAYRLLVDFDAENVMCTWPGQEKEDQND